MQENFDNQQSNTPEKKASLIEGHHTKLGPVLGILVIVLVLIVGGLYLWGASLNQEAENIPPRAIENNEPETPRAQADAQILSTVSSSDSLDAIETDVTSTNLDSIDTELSEIEQEFAANANK